MMRALLTVLVLVLVLACGPQPAKVPYTVGLEYLTLSGAEAIQAEVHAQATALNARCGVELVRFDDRGEIWFQFTPYDRLDGMRAVSYAVTASDGWLVIVAVDGLPAEESTTGKLSPCEAGYLFLHYVGRYGGLKPQYDDPSHITYAHPNCPGLVVDPIGDLLKLMHNAGNTRCLPTGPAASTL